MKTKLKRLPKRGSHDRNQLNAILDAGLMCHVAYVYDGYPVVTPTLYWRTGDHLYWHGAFASRMLAAVAGNEVCVTVSLLDGLVLARSAFHHSANYRSAMIFGRAVPVTDPAAKLASMKVMMDSMMPGRFEQLRPVRDKELDATTLMALPLEEFSIKSRTGDAQDDIDDMHWPVWAGVLTFAPRLLVAEPTTNLAADLQPPALVRSQT